MELTDYAVKHTKLPKGTGERLEIWDEKVPGFGVRITSNGARSYTVIYWHGGRKRRYTIGDAKLMKLADARKIAKRIIGRAADGKDPQAEKKAASVAAAKRITFGEVADAYLLHAAGHLRPSTLKERRRIIEHDVRPQLGKRSIDSITGADVERILDSILERGSTVQANRTLAGLSTVLNWCVKKKHITMSPCEDVDARNKERSRERCLTDREIVWFWKACEQEGWPFGPIFQLLLLTAQRRSEVGRMEWSEVALADRLWVIPGAKAKNGKAHHVPLSDPAVEILTDLRQKVGDDAKGYVFTTTGDTEVSGYSRSKARLDKAMEALARKDRGLPEKEADYRQKLKLGSKVELPRQVPEWILHDLRRTATTAMADGERLSIAPHVVDKILNHAAGAISGVAAIYNRNEYLKERRAALEAWGRYVLALLQPPAESNVHHLRR